MIAPLSWISRDTFSCQHSVLWHLLRIFLCIDKLASQGRLSGPCNIVGLRKMAFWYFWFLTSLPLRETLLPGNVYGFFVCSLSSSQLVDHTSANSSAFSDWLFQPSDQVTLVLIISSFKPQVGNLCFVPWYWKSCHSIGFLSFSPDPWPWLLPWLLFVLLCFAFSVLTYCLVEFC